MKHSHQESTPLPSLLPFPVPSSPLTLPNPPLSTSLPSPNASHPLSLSPPQPHVTLPHPLDRLPAVHLLLVDQDPLHLPDSSARGIERILLLRVLTRLTYLEDPRQTLSVSTTSKEEDWTDIEP